MSNQEIIRNRLLAGDRLTVCGCAAKYQTGDLRKYISNIRNGKGCEKLDVKDTEKVSSKGGRYKEYYIN